MKKAFTLLELVFVLVIIGILATQFFKTSDNNNLQLAANQVISHIRYTQHLAMMDDKFDANDEFWYKKRWQIAFSTSSAYSDKKPSYAIYRNTDIDSAIDKDELAMDPLNRLKYMSGGTSGYVNLDIRNMSKFEGTENMNIGKKFAIKDIELSSTCTTGSTISFDYLGRPLKGPLSSYTSAYPNNKLINEVCIVKLCNIKPCDDALLDTDKISIYIEPETGYAHF